MLRICNLRSTDEAEAAPTADFLGNGAGVAAKHNGVEAYGAMEASHLQLEYPRRQRRRSPSSTSAGEATIGQVPLSGTPDTAPASGTPPF